MELLYKPSSVLHSSHVFWQLLARSLSICLGFNSKMKMTLRATSMAAIVVVVFLCCGMVAPAEGRALLNIGKLIDHLKGHCPPPAPAAVSEPYTTPSQPPPLPVAPLPPYGSSPFPVDPSPASYTPPAGGY